MEDKKEFIKLLPIKKSSCIKFFYDTHIENVRKIDSLFDNLD